MFFPDDFDKLSNEVVKNEELTSKSSGARRQVGLNPLSTLIAAGLVTLILFRVRWKEWIVHNSNSNSNNNKQEDEEEEETSLSPLITGTLARFPDFGCHIDTLVVSFILGSKTSN